MATATYVPIATTTLSGAGNITFSSIPSTYTDLCVVIVGTTGNSSAPRIQFNSDTATNYSNTRLFGDGTTASANFTGSTAYIDLGISTFWTTTTPAFSKIDIFSYAGSTYKTVLVSASNDQNGSGRSGVTVGMWRSTSAITSITLTTSVGADFSTGTTATLYGITKA